jgi:hypothetical protein
MNTAITGLRRGIALQRLQERGQQHDRAEQRQPDHEHERQRNRKIAITEQMGVDERVSRCEGVHHEHVKTDRAEKRFGDDLGRREPVERVPAIEHQLKQAESD